MNLILWLAAGGIVAWVARSVMDLNQHRNLIISAGIGIAGGFFGGHVLGPMFGTIEEAGAFNPLALFMAFVTAMACVALSDMMYERFGV